jgi:hypothetical protein
VPPGDLLRRLDCRLLPVLARSAVRLSQPAHGSRLLGTAATVSVAAVVVTAIWAADGPAGGDPTVGEVVRVGVAAGDSIPAYVQASRAELAVLVRASSPTETYALVTLSEYATPARLATILRGVSVSEVVARVPLPETRTEIVRLPAKRLPADAEAAMVAVADGKDREARDYRDRGSAVSGNGQRERALRRLYETGAAVARAEASAFRAKCGCLYAAVVRGIPADLAEITERSGVRSVDAAPEVHRLERAVLQPPLPEQTDVVRPPAGAGLPVDVPIPSQAPVLSPPEPVAPTASAASAPGPVPTPVSASPYAVPTDPPTSSASPGGSAAPSGSPSPSPVAPPLSPAPTPTAPR